MEKGEIKMLNIIINIICFVVGGSIGTVMGAFMASAGARNKEFEQYCQGFSEGYKRKKAEMDNENKVDK